MVYLSRSIMKRSCYLLVAVACFAFRSSLDAADTPPPFDTSLPGASVAPKVRPPRPSLVPQPTPAPVSPPNYGPLPAGLLAFDSESKEYITKPGEYMAIFVFNLTNVSPDEIVIRHVQASCGCTTAQLPPMPWKIPAAGTGQIPVNMNLQGKSGVVAKSITLHTDKGLKALMVKGTITQPDPNLMTAADRERNQLLAKADRQAIFKGDCARCHVEPVIGKMGKELYTTACGVCHEAEHRATMVPDLRNLPNDTNADYWKLMVTIGKPNTLMAAFAQSQGGPLSDMQINSLVEYLVATMPAHGTNSRTALNNSKGEPRLSAGH